MKWSVVVLAFMVGTKFGASEQTWSNDTRLEITDADAFEAKIALLQNLEDTLSEVNKAFQAVSEYDAQEIDPLPVVSQVEENVSKNQPKNSSFCEPPEHHEIIAGVPVPAPIPELLSEIHKFWEPFKEVHNKVYLSLRDVKRKKQWMENLIRVHEHNEEARQGRYGFYLRANHLSDLNIREYIRRMVRLTKSDRDSKPPPRRATYVKRNINVPEEWNWVEQGFVTPAWDQESCGSCYAFSIAASAQGQYFRKTRELKNLSVQQIVDCSIMNGNLGCYGGSLRNALRYCTNVGGLMSAEEYPYRAKQRLCRYKPWHSSVNVTSYVILPEYDEEAIQEAVATVGPVACSVDASPYTFQLYHKGIYDDSSCSSHKVNHAMLIVGYTKDAWILKNWWGEYWGINGYMYLKKGVNQCAISKYAGYPVVDGMFYSDTRTTVANNWFTSRRFSCYGSQKFGRLDDEYVTTAFEDLKHELQPTMPFVDLTLPEREKFLKQTTGSHIPGYTGHCPTLKFRFGKRFGADTREIIEELRDVSPVQFLKPYKEGDPELKILRETVREKGEEFDPIVYTNLAKRPFILGYTGYIPGLNFEYGIPFSNAAHKSLKKFTLRLADEERKREKERMQFLNTPKMCCVRSRDEVSRAFEENTRHLYNAFVPPVQPELPPIAGYTGHIPRIKGNEVSLSQRYYSAAKAGLSLLREERNKRKQLDLAKQAVADAIAYSHAVED